MVIAGSHEYPQQVCPGVADKPHGALSAEDGAPFFSAPASAVDSGTATVTTALDGLPTMALCSMVHRVQGTLLEILDSRVRCQLIDAIVASKRKTLKSTIPAS